MGTQSSGYPGKKTIGIGGIGVGTAQSIADEAAFDAVNEHEGKENPHPQYDNVDTFNTRYMWRAVIG